MTQKKITKIQFQENSIIIFKNSFAFKAVQHSNFRLTSYIFLVLGIFQILEDQLHYLQNALEQLSCLFRNQIT